MRKSIMKTNREQWENLSDETKKAMNALSNNPIYDGYYPEDILFIQVTDHIINCIDEKIEEEKKKDIPNKKYLFFLGQQRNDAVIRRLCVRKDQEGSFYDDPDKTFEELEKELKQQGSKICPNFPSTY